MEEREPKWTLGQAIEAGKKSLPLVSDHKAKIEPRLEPEELDQHQANVDELEIRRSGQKQSLSNQKSKTGRQGEVIAALNGIIVGIRNMIRSKNPTVEISEAFGVGERIVQTVGGVTAAANIISDAYKKFPAWGKKAGIIDADMTKIAGLLVILGTVEKDQDDSIYVRKAKTLGKNELQRTVEDEVTRISAIGAYVFHDENPAIAKMFEGLIPYVYVPKAKKKGVVSKTNTESNGETTSETQQG